MSDSFAVVRNTLMHIAGGVLVEETPAEAEALLVEDLADTLADLLRPPSTGGEDPTPPR